MAKQNYICPKCGNENKNVTRAGYNANIRAWTCTDCGFQGIFLIIEKIEKIKKLC
jgi:transposase-like protein